LDHGNGDPLEEASMTVVFATEGRIRSSGFDESLQIGLELAKLHVRLGATSSRVLYDLVGGEGTGSWVLWSEFESGNAYGQFVDAKLSDSEAFVMDQRLDASESPVQRGRRSLAVELPLARKAKGEWGQIVELRRSQLHPGRLDDAIAAAKAECAFAERHGARRARLFRQTHGDQTTGHLVLAWEFENASTFGGAIDAWSTDAKGRALAAEANSENAPVFIEWRGAFHVFRH
jgi:hypothetical protein